MSARPLTSDTLWVFICCSEEPRHFDDIVYGYNVLSRKGVPTRNTRVFLESSIGKFYLEPHGVENIFPLDALEENLSTANGHQNIIAIVGGHGSTNGIGRKSPLQIANAIRSTPHISQAVLVLTQCFCGIFNYIDANKDPKLVVIGATGLHQSLSLSVGLQEPVQTKATMTLQSWNANIFGLMFFEWIANPVDIDGDGRFTLVDAYKFAGVRSNEYLRHAKVQLFKDAQSLFTDLREEERRAEQGELVQLDIDAVKRELEEKLNLLYISQEPWILHANLARETVVDLGFSQ